MAAPICIAIECTVVIVFFLAFNGLFLVKNYTLVALYRGLRQMRKFLVLTISMKKALIETQTLRAGCCKAEPKIFAWPQTPSPGRGTAKI